MRPQSHAARGRGHCDDLTSLEATARYCVSRPMYYTVGPVQVQWRIQRFERETVYQPCRFFCHKCIKWIICVLCGEKATCWKIAKANEGGASPPSPPPLLIPPLSQSLGIPYRTMQQTYLESRIGRLLAVFSAISRFLFVWTTTTSMSLSARNFGTDSELCSELHATFDCRSSRVAYTITAAAWWELEMFTVINAAF